MTKIFQINVFGDLSDKSLAFITEYPEGLGLYTFGPAKGESVAAHYPSDARITLHRKRPGIKLASFLGNTLSYLIVHDAVRDVMMDAEVKETEILPFELFNHRGRVHSTEYSILNPLGTHSCVDLEASEIVYLEGPGSEIVDVDTLVLDSERLADAPDLFRVPEDPERYFISEKLLNSLREKDFSNLVVDEVSVSGGE